MDRLRKCITANGEYTDSTKIADVEESNVIRTVLRCLSPGGTPCILNDLEIKRLLEQQWIYAGKGEHRATGIWQRSLCKQTYSGYQRIPALASRPSAEVEIE
jgi:hypothetical protein